MCAAAALVYAPRGGSAGPIVRSLCAARRQALQASAPQSEAFALCVTASRGLMQNRTCFIVAHRLSRVVETGTHDTLIAQNGGAYQRLVRRQSV